MPVHDAFVAAATSAWLLLTLVAATSQLARGHRHSVLALIPIHFVLCGLPLLADLAFGRPEYSLFPGFFLASRDSATHAVYCAYVAVIPLLWWRFGRGRSPRAARAQQTTSTRAPSPVLLVALTLGLLPPVVAVLLSPQPWRYASYGAVLDDAFRASEAWDFHHWVTLTSLLASVCFAGILASSRRITLLRVIALTPLQLFAIWANGKRNIVAITLFLVGYVLWERGVLRGLRLVSAALLATGAFLCFSFVYQSELRGLGAESRRSSEVMEFARVDFGRDDVLKLAIFAELNPERVTILDHRGQSVLFCLGMYIPRSWWPDKPLPYEQYVTSAILLVPPRLHGWGVTTSVLEEAIANFGWFGMLIGPTFLALLCLAGDRSELTFVRVLTPAIATLFMTVQLLAFAPLFLMWCGLVLFDRTRRVGRPLPRRLVHADDESGRGRAAEG